MPRKTRAFQSQGVYQGARAAGYTECNRPRRTAALGVGRSLATIGARSLQGGRSGGVSQQLKTGSLHTVNLFEFVDPDLHCPNRHAQRTTRCDNDVVGTIIVGLTPRAETVDRPSQHTIVLRLPNSRKLIHGFARSYVITNQHAAVRPAGVVEWAATRAANHWRIDHLRRGSENGTNQDSRAEKD